MTDLSNELPDELPDELIALLRRPAPCVLSTLMPDGGPHVTQTWVDTDGRHVLVNTVRGFQKLKNLERDPRVGVAVLDPDDPATYWSFDGRVLAQTEEGGADDIERLSQKYLGRPYPWFGGRDQVRVVLTIGVERIRHRPWGGA